MATKVAFEVVAAVSSPTQPRLDGAPRAARNAPERRPPQDRDEPRAAYLVLAATYLGAMGTTLLWLLGKKRTLPKPSAVDLALVGLGTARLSRLITRDKVMRPLRAPFTVTEQDGPHDTKEIAKGSGMLRAAGELITCPRCTAVWAASGLSLLYLASPSAGRVVGLLLSSSLISDWVNRKFAIMGDAARGG